MKQHPKVEITINKAACIIESLDTRLLIHLARLENWHTKALDRGIFNLES